MHFFALKCPNFPRRPQIKNNSYARNRRQISGFGWGVARPRGPCTPDGRFNHLGTSPNRWGKCHTQLFFYLSGTRSYPHLRADTRSSRRFRMAFDPNFTHFAYGRLQRFSVGFAHPCNPCNPWLIFRPHVWSSRWPSAMTLRGIIPSDHATLQNVNELPGSDCFQPPVAQDRTASNGENFAQISAVSNSKMLPPRVRAAKRVGLAKQRLFG